MKGWFKRSDDCCPSSCTSGCANGAPAPVIYGAPPMAPRVEPVLEWARARMNGKSDGAG